MERFPWKNNFSSVSAVMCKAHTSLISYAHLFAVDN